MQSLHLREDFIKLGQALKAANLCESGVDAKFAVQDGLVKVNGKEQSRTVFNNSVYNPTNAVYSVGTKSDSSEATAAMQAAIATNDLEQVRAAAAKWKNAGAGTETAEDDSKTDESKKNTTSSDKKTNTQTSGSTAKKSETRTSTTKKNTPATKKN